MVAYCAKCTKCGFGAFIIDSSGKKRGHRNADGSRDHGLQIDLLIQTRKSVCVVEVRRRRNIGEEIEQEKDGFFRFDAIETIASTGLQSPRKIVYIM